MGARQSIQVPVLILLRAVLLAARIFMAQKQVEYIAQFRKESRGDSMNKLKIVYKHVDEIIPYVNNPRKISQNAIDNVASSIKNFGYGT